jgi:hypothetical protein
MARPPAVNLLPGNSQNITTATGAYQRDPTSLHGERRRRLDGILALALE